MKLTIREACRQRKPLDGVDAEALEHGLTQLEAELEKQKHESNRLYGVGQDIEELRVQLESENAAQAQTIKAAHIRTAEISTRYNDCQRRVDGWQALCMFEGNSSLHLLKLIADNLLSSVTPTSVKRAQANWLRRFIKVAANLETGGNDETD